MVTDIEGANVFILTSNAELKKYLVQLLQGEGYRATAYVDTPRDLILKELSHNKFDLILIDFENTNPIEICKKIRADFTLRHIPIILFIDKECTIEKIKGIYAGADDYVEKPIQAGELLTRIKASLWRANRDLDANPLTKLPGNVSILREIERRIKSGENFCVGYTDLDKFKEYNDYYGFEWGDKVIKHTALVISGALMELGTPNDFLGHIGGDDFIFITVEGSITSVCEKIIDDFNRAIPSFYKEEDLKRGYIIIKNREGKVTSTPLLTISIGVATNQFYPLTHVGQVTQIATELKNYAKTYPKSIYIIDRRKS